MREYNFLKALDELAAAASVTIQHVKGHAGIAGDERVDRLANEAREIQGTKISSLAPEAVKSELKRLVQEDRVLTAGGSAVGSRVRYHYARTSGLADARIATRGSKLLATYSRAECSTANQLTAGQCGLLAGREDRFYRRGTGIFFVKQCKRCQ